ncbi:MAG TPA: DUF2851 family protein [Ktedonobacteraceae bacterium]|nr:DUF2851 family protein [Ktedonobacteraceae bacterium]
MSATYVFEKGLSRSSVHVYEEDVVHRWWTLPLYVSLPLTDGNSYQLIYPGRPGGPAGPDICDAVLSFSHAHTGSDTSAGNDEVHKTIGDVEVHIRATDWFSHQHHTDKRYNNVVLHIVLICDSNQPTLRQDGIVIPTCSLNDIHPSTRNQVLQHWPCQYVIPQLNEKDRFQLFSLAGTLRFEMKAQVFFELLSHAHPSDIFGAYDVCLIPALAEGLGYGRDRVFFRAAGLHLIGAVTSIPEPLGRSPQPSSLDKHRLHMLRALVEQWRVTGAWESFRQILLPVTQERADHISTQDHTTIPIDASGTKALDDACIPTSQSARLQQLRNIFQGLGTARTDILLCNIVLPFAVAVAQRERCPVLAEAARNLYKTHPGLSSNQVTRTMCKQLLLRSEPKGTCQQQGLQHIYAQTCREKLCHECLVLKHGA